MERTVKVIRVNNPNEFRYVTPAAVQYLDTKKWELAESVPVVAKKKDVESAVIKRVIPNNVTEVAPVIIPANLDVKELLRTKFKEVTGEEADKRWNEGRLKIEISKLQVNA